MCVDVDEPWDVFASWKATAKCVDCGRVAAGVTEEMGPEGDWGRDELAIDMLLDNGVPDWSIDEDDDDLREAAGEVADLLPPPVEDTQHACWQCLEARRWLEEWCRSYIFGRYRDDIIEHWDEDEVTRSHAMGRLVLAAKRRWAPRGRLLSRAEVAQLVDRSLAKLRKQIAR